VALIRVLRFLFFLIVVRLVVLIVLGLRIRYKERLPRSGPAIVVANHNSHLDTLVLMSLFPIGMLNQLRPVAAEEYFLKGHPWLAWFSLNIIGIIPIFRERRSDRSLLQPCSSALQANRILIFYPEGSRGEPECLSSFKSGIAQLAKRHPTVPIVPVFLHGLGKTLPKGEFLLVPFFCDVFVGQPIYWTGDKTGFMHLLTERIQTLAAEGKFPAWK
jgi:1-acyl-sn-glycerol-3-phosphate acyltransferase